VAWAIPDTYTQSIKGITGRIGTPSSPYGINFQKKGIEREATGNPPIAHCKLKSARLILFASFPIKSNSNTVFIDHRCFFREPTLY
jgi:hypothetical protein